MAASAMGRFRCTVANTKWQTNMSTAPSISMLAPFPLLSRKLPRKGVMMAAPMGNQKKISPASVLLIPRLHSNIFTAYFWNGKMAE